MDATITELPIIETATPPAPTPASLRQPGAPRAKRPSRAQTKPRCADCFFSQNNLCALEQKTPCPTFRPAHPDGLQPPKQLTFAFRSDKRTPLTAPALFDR